MIQRIVLPWIWREKSCQNKTYVYLRFDVLHTEATQSKCVKSILKCPTETRILKSHRSGNFCAYRRLRWHEGRPRTSANNGLEYYGNEVEDIEASYSVPDQRNASSLKVFHMAQGVKRVRDEKSRVVSVPQLPLRYSDVKRLSVDWDRIILIVAVDPKLFFDDRIFREKRKTLVSWLTTRFYHQRKIMRKFRRRYSGLP